VFGRGTAANECYNEIELTLPNGRAVVGKVLPLKKALHFLTVVEKVEQGDAMARFRLVKEFPKAVRLEKELNELTWAEFWDVVTRFFVRRGSDSTIEQTEANEEEEGVTLESRT
jgi:hypothetical protein